MIILNKLYKQQEAYTPLDRYADRSIDFKTFLEGVRINFSRELILSFFDSHKESMIAAGGIADARINAREIFIRNPLNGLSIQVDVSALNISAINEVNTVSGVDYIFPLVKYRKMFYRINVK